MEWKGRKRRRERQRARGGRRRDKGREWERHEVGSWVTDSNQIEGRNDTFSSPILLPSTALSAASLRRMLSGCLMFLFCLLLRRERVLGRICAWPRRLSRYWGLSLDLKLIGAFASPVIRGFGVNGRPRVPSTPGKPAFPAEEGHKQLPAAATTNTTITNPPHFTR